MTRFLPRFWLDLITLSNAASHILQAASAGRFHDAKLSASMKLLMCNVAPGKSASARLGLRLVDKLITPEAEDRVLANVHQLPKPQQR